MTERAAVDAAARELIAGFDGEAAFLARHLGTGEEIGYQTERVMPTASTIKLLVLAELFRQAEAGLVDLDSKVPMVPEDFRGGSGILKDLSPDLELRLRDHATLMIALSDNTSTAVLARLLGHDRIFESGREWGMTDTSGRLGRPGGAPREYGLSTPLDFVRLLTLIATDGFLSPAACATMRDSLLTQQYHDQIGRYFPFSPYRREGNLPLGEMAVRSKSGFQAGIRTDAGIVDLPGGVRYVVCVMNEGHPDHSFRPEQPGAVLNGRLSRLILDAWWPAGVPMPDV